MKLYIDHQEPEDSEPRVAVSLSQEERGSILLCIAGLPVIRVTNDPGIVKLWRPSDHVDRVTLESLGFEFDNNEIKTY